LKYGNDCGNGEGIESVRTALHVAEDVGLTQLKINAVRLRVVRTDGADRQFQLSP
jgi:hypothetical protein